MTYCTLTCVKFGQFNEIYFLKKKKKVVYNDNLRVRSDAPVRPCVCFRDADPRLSGGFLTTITPCVKSLQWTKPLHLCTYHIHV